MKTHLLKTQDGLEFRITQHEAAIMSKLLDENKSVTINGNRITNADKPQIRRLPQAPASLALDAGQVFGEKTPRWHCLRDMLMTHLPALRKEKIVVYTSLIDWVAKELDTWDAAVITQYIRENYQSIAIHNISEPITRPDRSDTAPIVPENTSGRFCGRCMNGWRAGNAGLTRCNCNPAVEAA